MAPGTRGCWPLGMALGRKEPEWREAGCGPEQGLGAGCGAGSCRVRPASRRLGPQEGQPGRWAEGRAWGLPTGG